MILNRLSGNTKIKKNILIERLSLSESKKLDNILSLKETSSDFRAVNSDLNKVIENLTHASSNLVEQFINHSLNNLTEIGPSLKIDKIGNLHYKYGNQARNCEQSSSNSK